MPGIDRDFWLDFAKDGVKNGISTREQAADKLDSFLNWLWTIYSSVFALAGLFGYLDGGIWQLILAAQPMVVIMLARYCCTNVNMPSVGSAAEADPAIVTEIIDSYHAIAEDKRKKLALARAMSLVAMISLCAGIIGYSALDEERELKHRVRRLLLEKQERDNTTAMRDPVKAKGDSLQKVNDYTQQIIQQKLNQRRLRCIDSASNTCPDNVFTFSK